MDKIVLITGASRGIGAATALLAARQGWAVAVNYQGNQAAADAVVQQIRDGGGTALAVQADVADEAQVLAMFAAVDAQLGRITALVNNAGVVDRTQRVDEMSVARLRRMFDINVIGSFVCAREAVRRMSISPLNPRNRRCVRFWQGRNLGAGRSRVVHPASTATTSAALPEPHPAGRGCGGRAAALPALQRHPALAAPGALPRTRRSPGAPPISRVQRTGHGGAGGSIVNVSSAAARLGAAGQYVDYAAAKGAIDVLTLGLAREVGAEGIRVNAVRPGLIDTDIHASGGLPDRVRDLAHLVPMQRGGTAEEVAEAIVWLMSDASPYTTMSLLEVSGGR